MSARFNFTLAGINHLISSSEKNQDREFILHFLCKSNNTCMSLSELELVYDIDRKQLTKNIYYMLKKGWMSSVNESEENNNELFLKFSLLSQLTNISASNSAMLVDIRGLIIASTGFKEIDKDYLAASATALVSINSTAQLRNNHLSNSSPWILNMHWGKSKVTTQIICIGSKKFVLIIGDHSELDTDALIQLIAMLARRYING